MEEVKVGNSRFKRVCVFCGSSTGKRHCYQDAAVELGKELVARKVDLVYGGGSVGLMGLVSEAVHCGGGHVIGIIPRTLMSKEITGETFGEVKPVASMHQRKAEMARHSDAFIALPGGYGTLEELLEVITWAQLGIHNKPLGDRAGEGGIAQRGWLLQLPARLHRQGRGGWLHPAISAPHLRLRPQRQGPRPKARGIRTRGGRRSRQTQLGDGADGTKLHPARRDRSVVVWVLRCACIPRHVFSLAAVIVCMQYCF